MPNIATGIEPFCIRVMIDWMALSGLAEQVWAQEQAGRPGPHSLTSLLPWDFEYRVVGEMREHE